MAWIHPEDLVGTMLAALDDERWSGPVNATAPEPVSNRELSRALGRALHRPALLPVPGPALRLLYGEMAQIVTTGARVDARQGARARLRVRVSPAAAGACSGAGLSGNGHRLRRARALTARQRRFF